MKNNDINKEKIKIIDQNNKENLPIIPENHENKEELMKNEGNQEIIHKEEVLKKEEIIEKEEEIKKEIYDFVIEGYKDDENLWFFYIKLMKSLISNYIHREFLGNIKIGKGGMRIERKI